jgi:hypothetical protein
VPGEPGEPIGGAEPDEQQTDRRVGAGLGHLDQVLLAGQSMPVPQQHHDLHVAQRRKRGRLPGRGHRRRRPELLDDPELTFEHQISSGPAQASAEDVVVDRTFDDAVGHAIDALPEQFRTVVLLVDATGLSYLGKRPNCSASRKEPSRAAVLDRGGQLPVGGQCVRPSRVEGSVTKERPGSGWPGR